MKPTAIVVVAKAPQPGKVKTRLCPPLTHRQAATLYTGFLLDTIHTALQVPHAAVKVVCPSNQDAHALGQILPPQVEYIIQSGTGLTAALTTSFVECLEVGYRKVLCISSDNPTLPLSYLTQALEKLDEVEVVLGPTEDGGYYLVGAKTVYPILFQDMVWSTSSVLTETLERATNAHLQTQLLPLWYDLDTNQELERFIKELPQAQDGGKYTSQALHSAGIKLG